MSRVTVTCPSCAKTFHVDACVIGKQGQCSRCKHVFALCETTETYKLAEPPAEVSANLGKTPLEPNPEPHSTVPAPASASRPGERPPTCPSCANAVPSDAVICTSCGLDLRTGKRLETAMSDPPREISAQRAATRTTTSPAERSARGYGGTAHDAPAYTGRANAAVIWALVGLAVAPTSYVFGIGSSPTGWSICFVGTALGVFAIVLGVSAARRAKDDPTMWGGRFRAIGAIGLGVLLLLSPPLRVMMPAFVRAHQLASRAEQTQDLKNLGVSLQAYATDNGGRFPPDWTTLVDGGYANEERMGRPWTAAQLDAAFEYMPGLTNRDPRPVLAVARPGDNETHVQALHVDGHVDRELYEDWRNRNWSRYPKAMHADAASGNGAPASAGDLLVTEYIATGGRCLVHRFSDEGEYRGVFARGPEHEGAQRFWDITFAPDSLLLFVSYDRDPSTTSAVLRFDGTTGALISTDAPPGGFQGHAPRGLTFGPDGHLYVCTWSKEGGGLFEYDIEADVWNEIEEVAAANPRDVAFAPNGNLLLTASNEKHVREYERDGSNWTLCRTIPVAKLDGPEGLWVRPTGEVYVCSLGNDRVIQFNYDDPSRIRSFACGTVEGPSYVTIAPNGDLITAAYKPSSGPVIRLLDDGSCTDFGAKHLRKPIGLAFKP